MMLSKINVNPFHCPMFIAGLFTIAETWKHPKCPLTDDCIKKICVCVCVCVCVCICNGGDMHIYIYIYAVDYYSARKNYIMPFAATWMDLKVFILSEAS